jgi:hypothetical protein
MRGYQHVLFSVRPAGQNLIGDVTLYEDTWQNHIITGHTALVGSLADVEFVVSAPTTIFASTSVAGSYLFVKTGIGDSAGRSLRVAVGADRSVKSAYFSSAPGGSQLWP